MPDLRDLDRDNYKLTGDDIVLRYYVVVADVALLPVYSTNEHICNKMVPSSLPIAPWNATLVPIVDARLEGWMKRNG